MTSKVVYLGNLRTEAIHIKSNEKIITDAPVDNNGKGEAFSPTDLMATSLANCAITIMGISAQAHEINIDGTSAEITKHMASDPRRVIQIDVAIKMPQNFKYSSKDRKLLEAAARSCPVSHSLHPDIFQNFSFEWSDKE
jgi:putative redox protein